MSIAYCLFFFIIFVPVENLNTASFYIPQPHESSYNIGDEETVMYIYLLVFNSRKLFKPAKLIKL